jgi:hypothetical protein
VRCQEPEIVTNTKPTASRPVDNEARHMPTSPTVYPCSVRNVLYRTLRCLRYC